MVQSIAQWFFTLVRSSASKLFALTDKYSIRPSHFICFSYLKGSANMLFHSVSLYFIVHPHSLWVPCPVCFPPQMHCLLFFRLNFISYFYACLTSWIYTFLFAQSSLGSGSHCSFCLLTEFSIRKVIPCIKKRCCCVLAWEGCVSHFSPVCHCSSSWDGILRPQNLQTFA